MALSSTSMAGSLPAQSRMRQLGLVTLVAGLVGAASAAVIVLWPAQVPPSRYSYPFDATAYTVAQSIFALQHLGMLCGVYAVAVLARSGASRWTRAGLVIGMVGLVALSACELLAIIAASAEESSARGNLVDDVYGVPMILIGIGLTMAGAGLARHPVLPGWGRWIVLILGVFVFVPLFPAVFGPDVLGRLAIGAWMLLFSALGVAVTRAVPDPE